MIDFWTIDPSEADGPDLDAFLAVEIGWQKETFRSLWHRDTDLSQTHAAYWRDENGKIVARADGPNRWSPTTNPAHAGELRRKETYHEVTHGRFEVCVAIGGRTETEGYAEVAYSDCEGDRGRAEALAISRACLDALQAKMKASTEPDGS